MSESAWKHLNSDSLLKTGLNGCNVTNLKGFLALKNNSVHFFMTTERNDILNCVPIISGEVAGHFPEKGNAVFVHQTGAEVPACVGPVSQSKGTVTLPLLGG